MAGKRYSSELTHTNKVFSFKSFFQSTIHKIDNKENAFDMGKEKKVPYHLRYIIHVSNYFKYQKYIIEIRNYLHSWRLSV